MLQVFVRQRGGQQRVVNHFGDILVGKIHFVLLDAAALLLVQTSVVLAFSFGSI
jgi:hypothetical protein